MVAMRMIALTIALAFSTPAIAQDQVAPYTTVGQGGSNNALDINAAGACPGGLTLHDHWLPGFTVAPQASCPMVALMAFLTWASLGPTSA